MNAANGPSGLRPCEVKISANRKRTAAAAAVGCNRQPEPLAVQIKRKNCPYVYRKDGQEAENVHGEAAVDDAPFDAPPFEQHAEIPEHHEEVGRIETNKTFSGGNNVFSEISRMYPELALAKLQDLIKSAENARNQTSFAKHQNEPEAVKCARLPLDWSLKTSLMLTLHLMSDDDAFLAQVRKCSDSDAMARAITSFMETYSTSTRPVPNDSNLTSVLSAIRAASKMWCLSCVSLLNNGTIARHTRSSMENSKPAAADQTAFFESFVKELNAKWLSGLLSIFNLTKLQSCPYFYIVDDRLTAIVGNGSTDAPGDTLEGNPFSKLVASIVPAPPGVIYWLRNAKINFSAINENGVEIQKADGSVIQDSEETGDDESEIGLTAEEDGSKGAGHDDADSLSYFEELGVASMILENLKADGKAAEKKKQPLIRAVVIRGRAVLSFVNLLVETRGFPDRSAAAPIESKRITNKSDISSSSSRFPLPSLVAPVVFDCASLSSFRVRISVNAPGSGASTASHGNKNEQGSLAIQLTGGLPIPPFVVHRVFGSLTASGRSFSAQAETWQQKSQADHLNGALSSIPLTVDKEASLIVDKQANAKTFHSASFSSGFFSLPTN